MPSDKPDRLDFDIHIGASPETVFRFLTDPKKMMTWLADVVEADPRPGGIIRLAGEPGTVMRGTYVEVVPHRRVVFTWGWEGSSIVPPGSSTVEIELMPDDNGTRLRLRHGGLPDSQVKEHAAGWQRALPKLQAASEGRDPGGACLSRSRAGCT